MSDIMGEMGVPDLAPVEGRPTEKRLAMPQPPGSLKIEAVVASKRGTETNTGLDKYSSDQASYTGQEQGFFDKFGSDRTE